MRAGLVAVALVLAGCGGGGGGGGDLGTPPASGRDPRCPATAPANGGACDFGSSHAPLGCEYGGDALGRGTTRAICGIPVGATSPQWYVGTSAIVPNPPACPTSWADAMQSGSCVSDVNLACDYDEGRCACVCQGTTVAWKCRARSDVPVFSAASGSCATKRPLVGDACSVDMLVCLYDDVCGDRPLGFGPPMMCEQGYWEEGGDTRAACIALDCPGWTG